MIVRSLAGLSILSALCACGGARATPAATRPVASGAPLQAPSTEPAKTAAPTATQTSTPPPTPFGATRATRIAAFHADLDKLLRDWKLTGVGTDCALVFNEREEWLVGCHVGTGIEGFRATGEDVLGAAALWHPQALTLGGQTTPFENVHLSTVGTVVPQKNEKTGESSPVLVLQDWDALHATHPGFRTSGIEEWLGIATHEAFHAHQLWHPRIRAIVEKWATAKPATTDDLAAFVKANADYKTAVEKEVDDLRSAVASAPQKPAAKAALKKWLAARGARQKAFEKKLEAALPGKRAWEMDAFYTFLEGTARYVEARFLIAPSPETVNALAAEPTFKKFADTLGKSPAELPGLSKGGAKYVYAIGMYVAFLLDVADPEWKDRVFSSDGLLIEAAERASR